ncbi:hypothetical protein AYO20_06058 [Fonsecaea nubica]|uniref:C2H2-type domain-containing protein n=1 Tax=Fonsecaea nubica TaxID=856822 RepID=A0A178D0A5_9EURO|nr:hypothetical protein AYO20_06058 [Fonsecaea nubica]OAL34641.1 hypothetical protein AYO20_06058 [Fonsecaea nubica]
MAATTQGSSTAAPLFQLELTKFKSRLTGKQLQSFEFASLEQVEVEVNNIQRRQDTQRGLRNLTRIRRFIEAMEQFGKIIEVFVNTSDVLAFVWGPLKFLLLVSSTSADCLDKILDAYERIGEVLPLFQLYESLLQQYPEMQKVLAMMYKDILEFHLPAIRVLDRPGWKHLFRSAWGDFNTKFEGILRNLNRHGQLIESQFNLLQADRHEKHQTEVLRAILDVETEITKKLFRTVSGEGQRQYIVVDGLDECQQEERRSLLPFLTSLVKGVNDGEPGKLRVLIISQEEPDIRGLLSDAEELTITRDDNSQDIRAFVQAWTVKIQEKFGLGDQASSLLAQHTCGNAAGQFLFAKLVMENLHQQLDLRGLQRELESERFPKELAEALASVCLGYLAHPLFDGAVLEEDVLDGSYAFADYAVARWMNHLDTILVQLAAVSDIEFDTHQTEVQELCETAESMLRAIGEGEDDLEIDLREARALQLQVSLEPNICSRLRDFEGAADGFQSLWTHMVLYRSKDADKRSEISLERLRNAMGGIRRSLEEFFTNRDLSAESLERVKSHYGTKCFRCPKVTCFYFHEGFTDAKTRDRHVRRHERPFQCGVVDCDVSDVGFGSKKDLENHMQRCHPNTEIKAQLFKEIQTPRPGRARFGCGECGKSFVRAWILKDHQRAHRDQRDYMCARCGKAFVRKNDCRRHEKIHENRP